MSAPRLPDAPGSYDAGYMSRLLASLRTYFVQIEAVRHINIASCNINLDTLPTTDTGARDGDVWVDGNVLKVAGLAGGGSYQPLDADLTAIAALTGTAGFLKTNGAGTWSVDTATYSVSGHTHAWSAITSTPTTIAGYGITDFNSLGDARWAPISHNQAWSTITSTPTTIAGYGITDFNSLGDARWSLTGHTHTSLANSLSFASSALVLGTNTQVTTSGWQQQINLSSGSTIVLDSGAAGAGRYAGFGNTSDGNFYFFRTTEINATTAPTYSFWIQADGKVKFNQAIAGPVVINPGNSATGLHVYGSNNGGNGYYAGIFVQGTAQNYGKVLKLGTGAYGTSGTDGPQIHFIREGHSEWGFGIGSNTSSLVMYDGGNTGTFGTERFNFATSGNFTASGTVYANAVLCAGAGQSGEKQVTLWNANRLVYFFLQDGGTLGVYDSTGGFSRWTTDTSGNFSAYGNVTAYSDERLKKDFAPATLTLDQILSLEPETFTRTDNGQRQAGVRAQAVQKLLPETVLEDEAGMLSLNYGAAAMVLILNLAREVAELKRQLNGKAGNGN